MTTAFAPNPTKRIPITLSEIREDVQSDAGPRVDRKNGKIRNVKILGRHSKNEGGTREYSQQARRDAVRHYEGMGVNWNHPDPQFPGADRDAKDAIGWLDAVKEDGDDVRGDLNVITNHPHAGMLFEVAERNPRRLGLSHNAEGDVERHDGKSIVKNLKHVRSVDIVQKPATNDGLFESEDDMVEDDDEVTESKIDAVAILKKLKDSGAFTDAELEFLANALAGDDDFGKIVGGNNPPTAADDPDRMPVVDREPDLAPAKKFKNAVGLDSAGATGSPAPGGVGPDMVCAGAYAGGRGNVRKSLIGNATTTERTRINSQESLREALFDSPRPRGLNRDDFRRTLKRRQLQEVIAPASIEIPTGSDFARSLFGR